jgi:phage recombination protein Bet
MSTQTKTETGQAAPAPAPKKNLPAIAGARIRYPGPMVSERFGVDAATWRALVESVWPLARTAEAIILALSYCRAKHLDPMKKVCHIVPMWNSALNREVETVWPGIAELRTTAFRTAQYVGADATEFGEWKTETFKGERPARGNKAAVKKEKTVRFPEFAQITVYRNGVAGRVAFPGPRIYYREAFGYEAGIPVPNARWERAPSQMLEKCAEAAALRKAFPEEFGDDWTAEEMEGRFTTSAPPGEQARPAAADFIDAEEDAQADEGVVRQAAEEPDEVVDEETGEITATLAQETAANPQRTAAPEPERKVEPDRVAPKPAQEKVVAAAAEHGIAGEGLEAVDETVVHVRPGEDGPSEDLTRWEEYLRKVSDGITAAEINTADAIDDYAERVKAALKAADGLSDDERDDLRARFVSIYLNRRKALGYGASPRRR